MLQFGVIVALLFSLLIAVFAIANNQLITIHYLYGKAEVSAIVVILGSAIAGAVVMGFLNLVRNVKQSLQIRSLKQEKNKLEEQLQNIEQEKEKISEDVLAQNKEEKGEMNKVVGEQTLLAEEDGNFQKTQHQQESSPGSETEPIENGK